MLTDKALCKSAHFTSIFLAVKQFQDLYHYDQHRDLIEIQLLAEQARKHAAELRRESRMIREKCRRNRTLLQALISESRAIQQTTRRDTDASRTIFPDAFTLF